MDKNIIQYIIKQIKYDLNWRYEGKILTYEQGLKIKNVVEKNIAEWIPWINIKKIVNNPRYTFISVEGNPCLFLKNIHGKIFKEEIDLPLILGISLTVQSGFPDRPCKSYLSFSCNINLFSPQVDYANTFKWMKEEPEKLKKRKEKDDYWNFLDDRGIFHNEECAKLNQAMLEKSLRTLERELDMEIMNWFSESSVNKPYIWKYGFHEGIVADKVSPKYKRYLIERNVYNKDNWILKGKLSKKFETYLGYFKDNLEEIFPWIDITHAERIKETKYKFEADAKLFLEDKDGSINQTKIKYFLEGRLEYIYKTKEIEFKIKIMTNLFSKKIDFYKFYKKSSKKMSKDYLEYRIEETKKSHNPEYYYLEDDLIFHNEKCGKLNQKLLKTSLKKAEKILDLKIVKWQTGEDSESKNLIYRYGFK